MTDETFADITKNVWYTVGNNTSPSFHTEDAAASYVQRCEGLSANDINRHSLPAGVEQYGSEISMLADMINQRHHYQQDNQAEEQQILQCIEIIRELCDELEEALDGELDRVEHPTVAHARDGSEYVRLNR